MNQPKRVWVKEEFVGLTGGIEQAVLLDQMVRWSVHGWFHKSDDEMIEDTLLGLSRARLHRYLQKLIEAGWIVRRQVEGSPKEYEYQADTEQIAQDLRQKGYILAEDSLEGVGEE